MEAFGFKSANDPSERGAITLSLGASSAFQNLIWDARDDHKMRPANVAGADKLAGEMEQAATLLRKGAVSSPADAQQIFGKYERASTSFSKLTQTNELENFSARHSSFRSDLGAAVLGQSINYAMDRTLFPNVKPNPTANSIEVLNDIAFMYSNRMGMLTKTAFFVGMHFGIKAYQAAFKPE